MVLDTANKSDSAVDQGAQGHGALWGVDNVCDNLAQSRSRSDATKGCLATSPASAAGGRRAARWKEAVADRVHAGKRYASQTRARKGMQENIKSVPSRIPHSGGAVGRLLATVLIFSLTWGDTAATEPENQPPPEGVFVEGIFCGVCHTNSRRASAMRDAKQREIAPFDLWRSSAMANSARNPYWRAVVSVEVAATPARKAEIEETCTRCHAPMAAPAPESPQGEILHYLKQRDPRSLRGLDGVSCTVCHQITDEGFGTEASYDGHFKIGSQRIAFGPHANPHSMSTRQHAGYKATEGKHILKSAMCATCHTLATDTLNPDGTATGHKLHEQSPYLEWRNSIFNDEGDNPEEQAKSCHACHVPITDVDGQPLRTAIARDPGGRDFPAARPRSPFGRHTFVGGNTLLAQLLRDNPDERGVFATEAAFNATIAATRSLLQNETATITIGKVEWHEGKLRIPVRINNLTGHKLPTAFPSRRAWLRLEIRDTSGHVLFASGQFDQAGRITDADGHVLDSELAGGPIQPHFSRITKPAEVQIYESVMADKNGKVTFTLLHGARYFKDNRLLPRGWNSEHPDAAATAPVGVADDGDFRDGEDVVLYEVPVDDSGPMTIHLSLHYQSIGIRHVGEVFTFDTPEVKSFKRMYDAADRAPETLGQAVKNIPAKHGEP